MREAVHSKTFPGGVLLVSIGEHILFFNAYGYANIFTKQPVNTDTLFDLASLTKPLATGLAVMKLVEQGRLDLDQPVGSILPLFKIFGKSRITIRHLLNHTSGLPAYKPYYKHLRAVPEIYRKTMLKAFLVKEALINSTGKKCVYSDIGFMILCWVVGHVSGMRLDRFVCKQIYYPLNLDNLFFIDINANPRNAEFAATEYCPWRKMLLSGQVHDDNAWVLGGIQGHAGLFGTARNIHSLLCSLLAAFHGNSTGSVFSGKLVQAFFKPQKGTDRSLGFDTPDVKGSSSGRYFSAKSVGHLGFTGTSFWMDTDNSAIVILLTNRVHPSRDNISIRTFRPRIHDAVVECLYQ